MISIFRIVVYTIIFFIFIKEVKSEVKYNNKNVYCYNTIEYCFKNEFIEKKYKDLEMINIDKIEPKLYKTKLDNIILYI